MKERDPYHIALRALTGFAGAGRFRWGEPLVATALAAELRLSPTPVREALARLAGEGVLEHRPGRGYFAPSPSTSDIAELYELHWRLAHWALDAFAAPVAWAVEGPSTTQLRLESLYGALVAAAGNAVLARTQRRTAIQLRPIRTVEAAIAPIDIDQLERQEALLSTGRLADLRAEVDVYHRGRVAASQAVFAVMRRSGESIDEI
ncbi:DNA-binding GntR family transcriptional regulator [Brevundimonas alba]|uniref:DNA-binding GntR family transcriptional regulator n=1 Tax=Brevundimonas alba TaxID=74314 RepID=A0A7X5YLY4_9CAUL|nr:GntR family transcriptional regulator [Brevundimonas alba]NJC42062.1 DNA-binding GntR family transcriptional regulator [Brevundimonas alba]